MLSVPCFSIFNNIRPQPYRRRVKHELRVTSSNPRVVRLKARVVRLKARVRRLKAQIKAIIQRVKY